MKQPFINAFSEHLDPQKASDHLSQQLGDVSPVAIFFFTSHKNNGALISKLLRQRYQRAEVIGCTTCGAFTEKDYSVGGTSLLAIGPAVVKRCGAALARFEGGIEQGVQTAINTIGKTLNADLRTLSAKQYVGIVLLEGLKMSEETANEALGNMAPAISFVGGSAGDNLAFKETQIFYNGESSNHGAALLLMETNSPFVVCKTCSFRPTGKKLVVTRANEANRTIYELDGEPVRKRYAHAVGISVDELRPSVYTKYALGLMIDGEPWIRSPLLALPDGGIRFCCRIEEGVEVELMEATDLIEDLHEALNEVRQGLGGPIRAGLVFNCNLRRRELDEKNLHGAFLNSFSGSTIAGFHTYGESWLGHINQTLTALLFK